MIGFYFTYILSGSAFALGWVNPAYGLMVYYALAILRPIFLWFWAFNPYDAPRFSFYVGMSTLAGWLFSGLGNWSGLKGTKLAMFGLVSYFIFGIVAWQLNGISTDLCLNQLDILAKILIMGFATLTLIRDERSIRIFGWVMVASLGYLGYTLNEWYQINPMYLHNNGFATIDNNGVGMIMVMAVPLSFFLGVLDGRWWVRLACFFAVACEVHVILFSYSRGSQLGLIMVGIAVFIFAMLHLPRKMTTLAFAVLFVFMTLQMAGEGVRARFMSIFAEERDASAESRFTTWAAALNCMRDYPMGVGPRNFGFHAPKYGLTAGKAVHNLFLQTGADYGWGGMIGLTTFYLATFWSAFRMASGKVSKTLLWPRYYALATCTSLGGFLICSIFIGMENVEVAYMVALLGLANIAYVNRVASAGPILATHELPELIQVVPPGAKEEEEEVINPNAAPHPVFGNLRPA